MAAPLVIRNDMPIVGWIFGGLWIGGLVVISYIYARDGGFGQLDPMMEAGVMLLFWMGALVLFHETLGLSLARLTIEDGRATLRRQWIWKRRVQALDSSILRQVEIRKSRDSDGDPYYKLVLVPAPHDEAILTESGDRAEVEAVRDSILSRL